jgi:hypothetical protein
VQSPFTLAKAGTAARIIIAAITNATVNNISMRLIDAPFLL